MTVSGIYFGARTDFTRTRHQTDLVLSLKEESPFPVCFNAHERDTPSEAVVSLRTVTVVMSVAKRAR